MSHIVANASSFCPRPNEKKHLTAKCMTDNFLAFGLNAQGSVSWQPIALRSAQQKLADKSDVSANYRAQIAAIRLQIVRRLVQYQAQKFTNCCKFHRIRRTTRKKKRNVGDNFLVSCPIQRAENCNLMANFSAPTQHHAQKFAIWWQISGRSAQQHGPKIGIWWQTSLRPQIA